MLLEEIRVHEHFILIIVTKKITVFNNIMVLLKMFKKYTHTHWKFFVKNLKIWINKYWLGDLQHVI